MGYAAHMKKVLTKLFPMNKIQFGRGQCWCNMKDNTLTFDQVIEKLKTSCDIIEIYHTEDNITQKLLPNGGSLFTVIGFVYIHGIYVGSFSISKWDEIEFNLLFKFSDIPEELVFDSIYKDVSDDRRITKIK